MSEGGTTGVTSSFLQAHQTLVRTEPVVRRKAEMVSMVVSTVFSSDRACAALRGESPAGGGDDRQPSNRSVTILNSRGVEAAVSAAKLRGVAAAFIPGLP